MAIDFEIYDPIRLAKVTEQLGPADDPYKRNNLISVRDAVAIADLSVAGYAAMMPALGSDQRKLVECVTSMRRNTLGRAMTDDAAEGDVWLAINNNIKGGGYYRGDLKLIALELKDNGTGDSDVDAYDMTTPKNWMPWNHGAVQSILYHELDHYGLDRKGKLTPPSDIRPVDKKLWELAAEAHATMVQQEGMRRDRNVIFPVTASATPDPADDPDYLRFTMINLMRNDKFHKAYYDDSYKARNNGNLRTAESGRPLTIAEFAAAFGDFPTQKENFLDGHLTTMGDIYAAVLLPKEVDADTLKTVFSDATQPMNFKTAAALEAEDGQNGAKVLMAPDASRAAVFLPGRDSVIYQEFEKSTEADGREGYRQSAYSLVNVDKDGRGLLPGSGWFALPEDGFIAVKVADGKVDAALAHRFQQSAGIGYVSGNGALLATPVTLAPTLLLANPSGDWVAQQRVKTVNLMNNFGTAALERAVTHSVFSDPPSAATRLSDSKPATRDFGHN